MLFRRFDSMLQLSAHMIDLDVCSLGTGTFATDAFEDVGHSVDARELMKKYAIGKLAEVSLMTLLPLVSCL